MGPVATITAVVGMAIPRSAAYLYTVNLSYYMLCLVIVVNLMFTMFGSRKALYRYLVAHERDIKLNVPPYFTWMKCLPTLKGTPRNVTIVEILIVQTVIVRLVFQVIELIAFYESGSKEHVIFVISHVTGLISMFIAFYFVYVMIDLGRERLAPYRFPQLFRLVDLAMTMGSLQKFVVDFFVGLKFITPTSVLSANSAGQFYLGFLLCWEMLGISLIATYIFHPSETPLFDGYANCQTHDTDTCESKTIEIPDSSLESSAEQRLEQLHSEESSSKSRNSERASPAKRVIVISESDEDQEESTQKSDESTRESRKSSKFESIPEA